MSQVSKISNGSSSNSFAPNQTGQIFDDFTSYLSSNNYFIPAVVGLTAESLNGTATNPGILWLQANNVQTLYLACPFSETNDSFIFGAGTYSLNFVLNLLTLGTVSNNYTFYIGWMTASDVSNPNAPGNGVYFQYNYNVNGGKWQIVTNKGGTTTVQDSGVLVATGFNNFGININAAGTSASFFINHTQVSNSPINTNIPTIALSPSFLGIPIAGNISDVYLDLVYLSYTLNTAR